MSKAFIFDLIVLNIMFKVMLISFIIIIFSFFNFEDNKFKKKRSRIKRSVFN